MPKELIDRQVMVRFPASMLREVSAAADADTRTVSSWIRHVIRQELDKLNTDHRDKP